MRAPSGVGSVGTALYARRFGHTSTHSATDTLTMVGGAEGDETSQRGI